MTVFFTSISGAEEPIRGLTIDQAVDTALHENRDLRAARIQVEEARARLVQSGLFPNPSFESSFSFDSLFANEGERAFSAGISQPFSLSGRRGAQKNVARADIKRAFAELADIRTENRPYTINHEQVQRRIVVQFNVFGRDLGSVITEAKRKIGSQVKLPSSDYFIEYGDQFESQQRATKALTVFGIMAVLGIFMMLYQAFGNAGEAIMVMVNLPLALIGDVYAVFIVGRELSILSLIGFITLFGIATRNGVILITHYSQLRNEKGLSLHDAIIRGSLNRLNPILMTASVAALGLILLLLGEPTGKEIERPLAVVLLGGLFTSTFLNLVVIPTLYDKIETWREN
ncbi:MAG: efflux RND transporter permease subunit [Ignavibacteriales bacterium]